MELSVLAEDFFDKARQLRGMANNTVNTYRGTYKAFEAFLAKKGYHNDVARITTGILEEYFAFLMRKKNNGINSIHRKKDALSSLFKHAIKKDLINFNPIAKVEVARRKKNPRNVFIAPSQIAQLLISKLESKNFSHEMICAIRMTLCFTGVRRSELINLNWEHIDWTSQIISIYDSKNTSKKQQENNLDRHIPICSSLKETLEKIYFNGISGPVFTNRHGRRLGKTSLKNIVTASANAAGITINLTNHGLRHNLASHLDKLQATESDIALLFGHCSDSTTQGYIHSNLERVAGLLEKFAELIMSQNLMECEVPNNDTKTQMITMRTTETKSPAIQVEKTGLTNVYKEAKRHWANIGMSGEMTADFLLGFVHSRGLNT